MRADSRAYRVAILLLVSFCLLPILIVHSAYIVLQPVFAQSPNCTAVTVSDPRCCSDCLGIGDDNYNIMGSIAHFSGILPVLICGWLMDKFGNWLIIVFSSLAVAGYALVAIGGSCYASPAMLPLLFAGNFVWGIAFSSLMMARHRLTASWFKDKELFLAFGVAASIGRLSAIPSFLLIEKLREAIGLQLTLWLLPALCCISIACAIAVTVLDASGCTQLGLNQQQKEQQQQAADCTQIFKSGCEFWLLAAAAALFAGTYSLYLDNSVEFVHQVFHFSKQNAAVTSGILEYSGIVLFPLVGLLLDTVGRSILFLTAAIFVMVPAFLLLAYSNLHPAVGTAVISLAQTFFSTAGLGSVAMVVDSSILGTATATILSLRSSTALIGHAAVAAVLGHRTDLPNFQMQLRWRHAIWLMMATAVAAFCFAVALSVVSWKRAGPLTAARRPKPHDYEEIEESKSAPSSSEEQALTD